MMGARNNLQINNEDIEEAQKKNQQIIYRQNTFKIKIVIII